MSTRFTRRTALKHLGLAGTGFALSGGVLRGQPAPILVNGVPVEVVVASVSPMTVRLTVLTIGGKGLPDHGALVAKASGKPVAKRRDPFTPIRAGNLTVRFTAEPPTLHVDAAGKPVQKLTLDATTANVSFLLPKGPLLGFGEGGPQFDKKGTTDRMRNGQGGYQLRTHGGRVPIQWLVGTDGWGMYIHQPVVSSLPQPPGSPPSPPVFDFSGAEGRMMPVGEVCSAGRLHHLVEGPNRDRSRVRAYHWVRGASAALDVWLHAVASHSRGARRGEVGREDLSGEEASRATR